MFAVVVLFLTLMCSGFRSSLSTLICFISVCDCMCSLCSFTDKAEYHNQDRIYVCNLVQQQLKGRVRVSRTVFCCTDRSKAVPVL